VKLEQASKAAMWTPTRRKIGKGSWRADASIQCPL
jgi:hypothetical protein